MLISTALFALRIRFFCFPDIQREAKSFRPTIPFLQITVTSLIFNQFLQILAYFVYGDA